MEMETVENGSIQVRKRHGPSRPPYIYADVVNVTIADTTQAVFQGNHAKTFGGAIASSQHVAITTGSVQFINNSANNRSGGAIGSVVM